MQNRAQTHRILQLAFVFSLIAGSVALWFGLQEQPELRKWVLLGFLVTEGLAVFIVLQVYARKMQE
ncbi:hypothetical protein [Deinococcus cellulosilyticus]|uniref:Uncharacterized protein n=1 Tax=Deinococcus cellulosilyticus (strain DSM 18568 / NBRC 106333 / KACC 11606 / 5516J-15) TaxID=1223518 RepID=A0A511N515_DEIC1|nr:hypothetical protein [Deinococcus cellulosilyticus]GEM47578.1 hypothetical protein DC3_32130 [Deinococcus cellulosilyticus NBRC 106333 = KACC 11606]